MSVQVKLPPVLIPRPSADHLQCSSSHYSACVVYGKAYQTSQNTFQLPCKSRQLIEGMSHMPATSVSSSWSCHVRVRARIS